VTKSRVAVRGTAGDQVATALLTSAIHGSCEDAGKPDGRSRCCEWEKPLEDVDPGFPHGMLAAKADVINQDLLAFVRS
jgi:hypothetical protein